MTYIQVLLQNDLQFWNLSKTGSACQRLCPKDFMILFKNVLSTDDTEHNNLHIKDTALIHFFMY